MKKLLLVIVTLFLLVGCSKQVNLGELYNDIATSIKLPEMIDIKESDMFDYYNLNLQDHDYIIKRTTDGLKVDSIYIIKANTNEEVETIKSTLNNILDEMKLETESYSPENYKIVSRSKVEVKGNCIYLVMSSNYDEIVKIIKDNL